MGDNSDPWNVIVQPAVHQDQQPAVQQGQQPAGQQGQQLAQGTATDQQLAKGTETQVKYYDVVTGSVIPYDQVQENNKVLNETAAKLNEAFDFYQQHKRTDHQAARKGSERICPGGKTKAFDTLVESKHLCNLMIIGPPVPTPDWHAWMSQDSFKRAQDREYYKMQDQMEDLLYRLSEESLKGKIMDVFTSRKITLHQGERASETCVRVPYYMGSTLLTYCEMLNKAQFFFFVFFLS